jgi:hypothetical protein
MSLKFDLPPGFGNYLFLDIEASGLHAGSYPIEVGWCGFDLAASAMLIRPHPTWTEDDWSVISERVHGIARDVVVAEGADVTAVAARLNAVCSDTTIVSDRARFDQVWLSRLFAAADVPQAFSVQDSAALEAGTVLQAGLDPEDVAERQATIRQYYPHPHRAGPDARQAAALFLAATVPDVLEAIIAAAEKP